MSIPRTEDFHHGLLEDDSHETPLRSLTARCLRSRKAADRAALDDTVRYGHASIRKPDPRIATPAERGLADSDSVVNVGVGTRSYVTPDEYVVALEPSMTMSAQRTAGSGPVVQATAMSLPLKNDSIDAALAVLTEQQCHACQLTCAHADLGAHCEAHRLPVSGAYLVSC